MTKAIYAGSFDPPTNGHLWMIQEGSALFDNLIIAIGKNPDKKTSFPLDERIEMLLEISKNLPNTEVKVFEGKYLVNYADQNNADYILRGIRNSNDFVYEHAMRNVNRDLNKDIETIFLMPPKELAEVSSSLIKGLIGPEGWKDVIQQYVPEAVYSKILKKHKGQ